MEQLLSLATTSPRVRNPLLFGVGLILIAVSTVLAVELVCQIYAGYLTFNWAALKRDKAHYYQASSDRALAYELTPGFTLSLEGRSLSINRFGIRDSENSVGTERYRIALLGDSIAFGVGFSQEETISERLQDKLDPGHTHLKVLNFGVPGYGLDELARFLEVKNDLYGAHEVIYLLNPNDFARRDTPFEGADNGLYRMYQQPFFKLPWFLGKLLYRAHRWGSPLDPKLASREWYQWLYENNRAHGLTQLEAMKAYCDAKGTHFSLALLPVLSAFGPNGFELGEMRREIGDFAARHQIEVFDAVETFASDPALYLSPTEHFTDRGNARLASLLASRLKPLLKRQHLL